MKIAEYNEMMAYLTRPEPEVLPQPKPQELLDIQEENKIERQQETMDKASPFLMDESVDFIERENFNIGSDPREDFTKFRTLDEEIKTLGKKQGEKFLRYLGIYGDASFYQPELSITEKNTAKDFKGKKQLSEWWKTIPNQKRRNVRQSFKDYENFVGTKPAIRRKLYESLRTDKKFYNEFKKQAAKTSITEIADGGSRTSFNKIKNEFDDIVFKKQKQGSPPTKQVTDDGNKILKELKKNTKDSLAKIINKTKIPIERVNSALGALYRNNKDNDGKLRFGKISSKIQEKLNSLSNISVSNIKSELVKKGQATKEEVQQLIARPSAVLSKILPKGSVFEHTLPKNVTDKLLKNNLIDKKTYDTLYRTGSRTSPFLNDFKAKFDIQQGRLLDKYLQDKDYKSYKKEINKIKKTISDKTGGYKIGYVDFKDGKMNIVANAKPLGESLKKFGPETTQKYLALDNIKYTNNLLQNYNNNPNDEAFSSMFNKRTNITPGEKISKEIVEDYKFLEKSYNSAKPFLKSTAKIINFAKNNLNNPVTKALFANPFGRAAGIATTALVVPSALLADESRDDEVLPFINKNEELETQDETSLAGDIGAAAGLTTGASIASKATKADPLKGVRRFGKKGAKNLLKVIGKVAGSPSAALGFGAYELGQGNTKLAGASLLAPEVFSTLAPAGKGILSRAGSILMNPFGKYARAFTPVGLATIGAGMGKDVYDEYKRREALTDEERLQEDIEAQAKDDEMMVGAAEGGRIGFADGNDPKNPGRRTFIKGMGILAALPFIGKFIKPATPLVKKLANSNTVMPDWFPNFVDKFVGRSIGKKIDADLIEYTNPDLPNVKLTRKDDGSILVEGKNEFNESYNINYEPPGYELIDETTGKAVKTPGNFEAVEGRHVALGPEDYDTDAFYADDLDELYTSDIADMEKYTTGNVTDTAKDAFGRDTGLKKGMYDSDMAQGRAENQADILRDEGLDEID